MDAPLVAHSWAWSRVDLPIAARVARSAAICLFALLGMAALLLCVRRAGGALSEPLATPALFAAALLLALAAVAVRRFAAGEVDARGPISKYLLCVVPAAVLGLWAIGLLLPGTTGAGAMGLLALFAIEEVWSWRMLLRDAPRNAGQPLAEQRQPLAVVDVKSPLAEELDEQADQADQAEQLDQDVSQRVVRRREEDGGEAIEGLLLAEFQSGERQATVHLAICPPFARVPVCYAEPVDGPSSQVKVAQVLPYGVRFEVKLDEPADEACAVTIEFVVREHDAE